MLKHIPHRRNKDQDTDHNGGGRESGILESGRRGNVQDQVPQDSASDSRREAQNGNAEDIHLFLDADNGSGNGKGNGTDDFQDKKDLHDSPSRKGYIRGEYNTKRNARKQKACREGFPACGDLH